MFWLRNKKNNFSVHTLIWGPGKHNYGPANEVLVLIALQSIEGSGGSVHLHLHLHRPTIAFVAHTNKVTK